MKKQLAIGVIGQGFVGGSLTTVFSERGFYVYAFDKAGKYVEGAIKTQDVNWSLDSLVNHVENFRPEDGVEFTGVYFVCVPTPMKQDGSADLSIVESVLRDLAAIPGKRIAIVKSTVPPGSTKTWNEKFNEQGLTVVFNPEFLTEANALDDMRNQNRIIVGGPRPASTQVRNVFKHAFPDVPIVKTGSTEAEMVKYFINSFLATKVSFANEMYQICEGLQIDYDKVSEYALYDERIGRSHLSVPGPDGSFGFGGSCFPKDLNALSKLAESVGIKPTVLNAAWEKNLEVRKESERDWLHMKGRAVSDES